MVLATGAWDYVLLARTADFVPWAKYVVPLALVHRLLRRHEMSLL